MSPRTRIFVIAGAAAAVAAGATVALAVITSSDEDPQRTAMPLEGAPPLALDLGVRVDPEARALRRAEGLLDDNRRSAARQIFERYDSSEAQVGAAIAAWPEGRPPRRGVPRPV